MVPTQCAVAPTVKVSLPVWRSHLVYRQVNEVIESFKGLHSKEQASLHDSQEVSLNSNTQLFSSPVTSRHEPPSGFTLSYQSPRKDRPGLPKPIADRYRGAGNVPIHQSRHCSHHRLTQRRAIKQNSQLAKLLMPTQASQAPPAKRGTFQHSDFTSGLSTRPVSFDKNRGFPA